MRNEQFYIPKHLDDPVRWLFWTMDEAALLLSGFVFGVVFNHILITALIGCALMLLLKKLKGREGHTFLLRLAYWHLPLSRRAFKATPPSYIREYVG